MIAVDGVERNDGATKVVPDNKITTVVIGPRRAEQPLLQISPMQYSDEARRIRVPKGK